MQLTPAKPGLFLSVLSRFAEASEISKLSAETRGFLSPQGLALKCPVRLFAHFSSCVWGRRRMEFYGLLLELASTSTTVFSPTWSVSLATKWRVSHSLLTNACSVLNSLSYLKRNCRSCTFVVAVFLKTRVPARLLKGPSRFPLQSWNTQLTITPVVPSMCQALHRITQSICVIIQEVGIIIIPILQMRKWRHRRSSALPRSTSSTIFRLYCRVISSNLYGVPASYGRSFSPKGGLLVME